MNCTRRWANGLALALALTRPTFPSRMRLRSSYRRLALVVIVAGCRSASSPATSAPAPTSGTASAESSARPERGITPRAAPPLPAIAAVDGPLAPRVQYPSPNQAIGVRDSNFIFGTIGSGRASLTINDAPVTVAPNGVFLAYLPVPPPSAPRYTIVARNGADSASLVVPVRVPAARADLALTGPLVVDSGSASPRGGRMTLREDEAVRVSVRAPVNASAWVGVDRAKYPLVNTSANLFATDVTAGTLRLGATLFVARGADTVRFALAKPAILDPRPSFVVLGDFTTQPDSDATVIGRSTPSGTYKLSLIHI